jgi:BirA family biotin operon repressor/biotin-[acetyl-CoA-carboxylase] ligase
MTAAELPVPDATSLAVARPDAVPERTDLLLAVLQTLWESYDSWQAGGDLAGERLAASYAVACATIGQQVRVDLPGGGSLIGTATGIDPAGRLLVDGPDGRTPVGAGDVVHVRAATKTD